MPSDKVKNQVHLHFIVFIWGFTAILGALLTLEALALVPDINNCLAVVRPDMIRSDIVDRVREVLAGLEIDET